MNSFILIPGMLCSLCMKHGTSSSVRKTWIDILYSTIQRFNFIRHASSITHVNTMKAEPDLRRSEKSGDIKQSFSKVISVWEQALARAFKCLHWLCKEQIAYTTKYESLLQQTKSLGCGYLIHLHVAENAKYTSETFLQEVLEQSRFFSLMIDETIDVSITEQLILYFCYK